MGGSQFEMPTPEPVSDGASTATASKVQRVAGPVLAGAKADLLTVRNATKRVSDRVTSTIGKPESATVN